MSDKLAQLQGKRQKLVGQIEELRKKFDEQGQEWLDEQKATWEQVNKEYDETRRSIDEIQAVLDVHQSVQQCEEADRRANHQPNPKTGRMPGQDDPAVRAGEKPAAPTQEERAQAMGLWCRSQMGDFFPSEEQVALMQRCRIHPTQRELVIDLNPASNTRMRKDIQAAWRTNHRSRALQAAEERTMSAISFGAGGALVPETYLRTLELNMVAFGGVRQVADTITTSGGERIGWPTADDTGNMGTLLGESQNIGSSVDPEFGMVFWDAYKFSSKPTLVPYELLQDAWNDVPSMLGTMHGERLGRVTALYHTTGTGAAQPKGIVTCSTTGKTTANATAISWDELIELTHSIDPAYRTGASWMMHDNIILAIRMLKDGEGRYVWQSGIDNNSPDRLLGYPVTVSMEMDDSVASGKITALFGQLSKHKIRRAGQIRIYRLQERYRDTDQDGFVAFLREDSNMLDAGTAPVKHLLQKP